MCILEDYGSQKFCSPYCHQKELVCAIFLTVNVVSVLLEDEAPSHFTAVPTEVTDVRIQKIFISDYPLSFHTT